MKREQIVLDWPPYVIEKDGRVRRRADTEEARNYWAFVEEVARQVRAERPLWARQPGGLNAK